MLRKASLHKVCNIAYALLCCAMGATRRDAGLAICHTHKMNSWMVV